MSNESGSSDWFSGDCSASATITVARSVTDNATTRIMTPGYHKIPRIDTLSCQVSAQDSREL